MVPLAALLNSGVLVLVMPSMARFAPTEATMHSAAVEPEASGIVPSPTACTEHTIPNNTAHFSLPARVKGAGSTMEHVPTPNIKSHDTAKQLIAAGNPLAAVYPIAAVKTAALGAWLSPRTIAVLGAA